MFSRWLWVRYPSPVPPRSQLCLWPGADVAAAGSWPHKQTLSPSIAGYVWFYQKKYAVKALLMLKKLFLLVGKSTFLEPDKRRGIGVAYKVRSQGRKVKNLVLKHRIFSSLYILQFKCLHVLETTIAVGWTSLALLGAMRRCLTRLPRLQSHQFRQWSAHSSSTNW